MEAGKYFDLSGDYKITEIFVYKREYIPVRRILVKANNLLFVSFYISNLQIMEKVKIMHTDLEIAKLNFGGNVFGWTLDEKQSFEILDAFFDAGFNFIDTANTYAWWLNGVGGQSETIIGNWMKKRKNRDKMIIATKTGSQTKEHPVDSSAPHILKSAEESLKRLQTDYIDLYYTHFDDGVSSVAETMQAYNNLVEKGFIRYPAASNISVERLRESMEASQKNGFVKYVALQPHYNLIERSGYENNYKPLVEEFGFSVFPYYSLAAGFLTGKYRSLSDLEKSVRGKGVKKYLNDKGFAVLKALDEVSQKHGTNPATVAIGWLLHQPDVTAPIVSATSTRQLNATIDAVHLKLDDEDLGILNSASA